MCSSDLEALACQAVAEVSPFVTKTGALGGILTRSRVGRLPAITARDVPAARGWASMRIRYLPLLLVVDYDGGSRLPIALRERSGYELHARALYLCVFGTALRLGEWRADGAVQSGALRPLVRCVQLTHNVRLGGG